MTKSPRLHLNNLCIIKVTSVHYCSLDILIPCRQRSIDEHHTGRLYEKGVAPTKTLQVDLAYLLSSHPTHYSLR